LRDRVAVNDYVETPCDRVAVNDYAQTPGDGLEVKTNCIEFEALSLSNWNAHVAMIMQPS
jgi:hypothetical protein